MSKISIELGYGTVSDIIVKTMIGDIEYFTGCLDASKNIFVYGNQVADNVLIQRQIDARKVVLSWHLTPTELANLGFGIVESL